MAAAEGREGARLATGEPALAGFFAATQRRAFSLAFRITGDVTLAEQATETAYGELQAPFSESRLFDAVRRAALEIAPRRSDPGRQSYVIAAAVRATLESLGQLERSALELAHSGGLGVAAIAESLDEEPAAVRQALRNALLRLGALSREEGSRP